MDMNPRMTPLTTCPGATVYMPPEALTTPPYYSTKLDCFSHGVLTIQICTRNFPNPEDAHRRQKDPNSHNRYLVYEVPETERRKKDIDLIDHDHPLLPIALNCIADNDEERPSADELCERLAALKKDGKYTHSVKQEKDQGALILKLQEEMKDMASLIQKERASYQKELEEKDQLLQKERADHLKELKARSEVSNCSYRL